MTFSKCLFALSHDVLRNAAAYPAARARHTALAAYENPERVLRALAISSTITQEERNAIMIALLEEHRSSRSPLWQAMLITAFTPMLLNVRRRVRRKGDEDVDQNLLVAFLSALRDVRIGPYSTVAIRWATQKDVFRGIERESRALEMNEYDDDTHPPDVFGVEERDAERTEEILRILETYGDELFDVVLATHAGDDSAQGLFVNKKCAGQPLQVRAREYQRLVLARRRVVADIRASFAPKAA